ncbi:hypothetical protein FA95DRAFT_767707 [Auriscalpium vulgare]|uniref:Uncharacterized protein n=1 Tax=Auriscalpium vulgare TaxID=40419 RepID=A0ACB8RAX7_9AGAM|nr:hypothetical protein FA95DRAFT_767707 [Auriscalpium vulgare]
MDDFDAMFERVLDELAAEPYDESVPLTRTAHNFPAYGAFVVFTLDPVATMETLEDPVATEAARNLPARKYVGYVTQVIDLPMPDRRYHRCSCYILSRGLPIPSGETPIDEQMCIAIAPATHPGGRSALTPSPPLLWDDLYLHSSSIFTLRVTSVEGVIDHSTSPALTVGQYLDVMACTSADAVRWQALIDARDKPLDAITLQHAVEPETASSHACHVSNASTTSAPGPTGAGDQPEAESTAESESVRSSGDGSILSGVPSFLAAGLLSEEEDPRYQFVPVVTFELDISTVEELASASLLQDEIAADHRGVTTASLGSTGEIGPRESGSGARTSGWVRGNIFSRISFQERGSCFAPAVMHLINTTPRTATAGFDSSPLVRIVQDKANSDTVPNTIVGGEAFSWRCFLVFPARCHIGLCAVLGPSAAAVGNGTFCSPCPRKLAGISYEVELAATPPNSH